MHPRQGKGYLHCYKFPLTRRFTDCKERSEEHTSELQSLTNLVCRLLLEKKRVLAIAPNHAEALTNRGVALRGLKRFDDALASYDRALAIKPDVEAFNNRGNTLQDLQRFDDALASYDRALAIKPDHAEVLNNRGVALNQLERFDEAIASFDRALAINPDYAEAHYNRGNALRDLKRFGDALASYDSALAAKPDTPFVFGDRLSCKMHIC